MPRRTSSQGLHWIMERGTTSLDFPNNGGTSTLGFQNNLKHVQGSRVNMALLPMNSSFLFWKPLRPGVTRWGGDASPKPTMMGDAPRFQVSPPRCPPSVEIRESVAHRTLAGWGVVKGRPGLGGAVETALASGVPGTRATCCDWPTGKAVSSPAERHQDINCLWFWHVRYLIRNKLALGSFFFFFWGNPIPTPAPTSIFQNAFLKVN